MIAFTSRHEQATSRPRPRDAPSLATLTTCCASASAVFSTAISFPPRFAAMLPQTTAIVPNPELPVKVRRGGGGGGVNREARSTQLTHC